MVKIGMIDIRPHNNWPTISIGRYIIHFGRYFWWQSNSTIEARLYLSFIWIIKVV